MGNSCTLPARGDIAIPSRVIQIQRKELSIKRSRSSSIVPPSLQKLTTKFETISPYGTFNKLPNTEVQTAVDLDEEPKTAYINRPLPIKYDLRELGIGEHYLEKEITQEKVKRSEKKKNTQTKNEVTWDRILVQMRAKLSSGSQKSSLYTHVDICLKEFEVEKPKHYEKMLKGGPPMRYRWPVWKNMLDLDRFYKQDLYEKLKSLSSRWEKDINKDIHRTFPCQPYFASKRHDNIGQDQLFNVLKAISLYFPNIGYVQGMNFIMGFLLLLSGGNELDAFWVFVTLIRDHRYLMMGYFEKDFPLLNFYLYIFHQILAEELPAVCEHLKQQCLPDQFWVFKWFLTVFLYSVPHSQSVRIWDFVINYGLFSIIQVAIAILKLFEKDVVELDAVGLDQFFNHLKGVDNKDKKGSYTNRSNISIAQANQSIMNTPMAQGQPGQSPRNNPDFENHESIRNETSEFQYTFKEVDIEEVLTIAEKVPLSFERITQYAQSYNETEDKKLPDFYANFFKNLRVYFTDYEKQGEFQNDVDYYIMKSELTEKPNEEIVISNLNDPENALILNDLDF